MGPARHPAPLPSDHPDYYAESAWRATKARIVAAGEQLPEHLRGDEDGLDMAPDPKKCGHPYWRFGSEGRTYCRSCGIETTDMEAMGR